MCHAPHTHDYRCRAPDADDEPYSDDCTIHTDPISDIDPTGEPEHHPQRHPHPDYHPSSHSHRDTTPHADSKPDTCDTAYR